MTRLAIIIALAAASPALATPGGAIGTLQQGEYRCELPGDATGPAGIRQPGQDFTVHNSSRYSTGEGRGTYLLTGDQVIITSGPKQGQRFKRLSANFLREVDAAGKDTPLRCVRRVRNTD
ncbi:MAG: hypothetical protein O9283_01770 [Sphingomonadaceae bacterium]|nr:hypothetical protein [Sphingomonadaceae bacterium]